MREKIKKIAVLAAILLLAGCTGGGDRATGEGILLKNELSNDLMQPGGSVLLRTSINNFFDNELQNAQAKLTRSFGQLVVDQNLFDVGDIQANPNATARAQWQLNVRETASDGTIFTNKVRLCFHYNQTAWHEIALVNSFDIESLITSGTDTGPLFVTFSGIDTPYIYNDQVKSKVPISISIKNVYNGFVGYIDMSRDEIPNITYIEMRVFDAGANNGSPEYFHVMPKFVNPKCPDGADPLYPGCLHCDDRLYDAEKGYIKCYAHNLSVFGDETFMGTRLEILGLDTEELIELVEIMSSFDYCIESEDFSLEVFVPGGN